MDEKEMRYRLKRIFAIASGMECYASDMGRVCTIERLSRVGRLPADLRPDKKRARLPRNRSRRSEAL